MSENTELQTSYQKLRSQLDSLRDENRVLTEKVNSMVTILEAERAEKASIARTAIIEKINAISPDFKPTDDMDADSLSWILKGMELSPKNNSEKKPLPDTPINPSGKKLNSKYDIPEDLEEYRTRFEDDPRVDMEGAVE